MVLTPILSVAEKVEHLLTLTLFHRHRYSLLVRVSGGVGER